MDTSKNRQAGAPDELEITSAMIEAGLRALDEALGSYDEAGVVRAVYIAITPFETKPGPVNTSSVGV